MQSRPDNVTVGLKNQPTMMVPRCNPTNEMSFTYFTNGMRRRLGDKSNLSAVLLDQHITWIDNHLREVFRSAEDEDVRLEMCKAAITNLLAWLAWLRAVETFTIRWGGLQIVRPADGPQEGLPVGLGVVKLDLQKQTKSSQERTVDMLTAYTTASGKSLGWWFEELRVLTPRPARGPNCFIVCHSDGTPWTSHDFRYTHLYPLLSLQRSLGDRYLAKFDESPGKSLIANFWSFNMYRRGARSHVSRKRPSNLCKATPAEVIEHGRWKISRSSLDMPTAYLEWSTADTM
jgi:hypothetical protein